jgi:multicomponent Na+:H+ antiporter subunit C
MTILMAILIGVLYACGIYLMLRRNIVKLIFGLAILGHAANLLIFTVGGLVRANPPLAAVGADGPPAGVADPLPQALVLTAIVIGFALTAFFAVLIKRVFAVTGTDDTDALEASES